MPACCRDHAEITLQGKLYHEARCRICGVEWIQMYDPEKLEMLANRKKYEEENGLFHEPLQDERREEKKVLRRHPSIHGVYI